MKRWKKATVLSLSAILMLGGCGNGGDAGSSQGSDASQSGAADSQGAESVADSQSSAEGQEGGDQAEPGTVDKVTWFSDVNFWNPPTKWDTAEGTVMGGITKATGLEFEMNIPAEDGATKLALMIVNGELPDIISITDTNTMKELVDSGNVWDMEEFLTQYDPESPLLKGGYPEDVKQRQIERDGGWYAFASHLNSPGSREIFPPCDEYYTWDIQYGENYGILWNDTVLKEFDLKVEDLRTEEQVLEAFKKVKESDKTVDGASYIPILVDGNVYNEATLRTLEYFFGAMPIDDQGNYQDWIQAPESKHALAFLNTLVREGYLDANQFTIDNAGVKSYITSGRVLCFIGNKANTNADSDHSGTTWTSTGAILSSEGTMPVLPKNTEAGAGWIQTFISKNCQNPEKVAKWLSWMSSEEGLTWCIYGEEGKDFNRDENGCIVMTDEGDERTLDYVNTGLSAWWPFHNTSFTQHVIPAPEEGTEDYQGMLNQTALGRLEETTVFNSGLIAFPSNLIDPSSDEGIAKAQIDNYLKGQISTIVMTKDDASFEAEYDKLLEQLDTLGIAEVNAVYDAWYKEKCASRGESLTNANADKH